MHGVADADASKPTRTTVVASTAAKSERPKWLIPGVIAGVVLFLIVLGSIGGRDDDATPTASTVTKTVTVTAPPATVTETVTQAAAPAPLFEPPAAEGPPIVEAPPPESELPPQPLAPPIVEAPQEIPSSAYYRNCAAARAAGAAPLYVGDPGYRSGLDGDSDGVACE